MSDRNTWNGLKHTLANSWPLLGDKDWVWNPLIPWLDGTISLLFEKSKAIDLKKRLGAIAHPAITLKEALSQFHIFVKTIAKKALSRETLRQATECNKL